MTMTMPTLGVICHAVASTLHSIYVPNTKLVTLTIQKIMRCPKISILA